MSERCTIANKCFSDEFNLPIYEAVAEDFYTVAEVKQEVEKRIAKIITLGLDCKLSAGSIISYETKPLSDKKVIAEIEPVDNYKYIFRISKAVTRKCYEKYFDTIIYHELCHILQVDSLLRTHLIYFEDGELSYNSEVKDLIELLYEADNGHTKLWYNFVNMINEAFAINPPVDRFFNVDLDISDALLEDTFKQDRVVIKNHIFSDDFSELFNIEDSWVKGVDYEQQ